MICPNCKTANSDTVTFCGGCGAFLSGISPGSVVASRYEIVRLLGRGGMGLVYEARDRKLDERVALKVLRPDPSGGDDLARRFVSEIKLARRVRHPNVCGIHDYGEDGRLQFISMELVEGSDLKGLLRSRGALPAAEACDVAIQLAEGLRAVHAQGIVHRDLKTSNIMRDSAGAIRLMDFGIARRVTSEGTDMTATGQVVGTPEYMSPEQARGSKVDQRTDIYSLGIVIYEICTGQMPFVGETPVATILKHLHEPPPLATPTAERIPEPLRLVLRRALAKDPDQRYADMGEVIEALRAVRLALPEAATVAAPPGRAVAATHTPRPATPAPTPAPAAPEPPRTPAAPTVVTPPPRGARVGTAGRAPQAGSKRTLSLALGTGLAGVMVLLLGGSVLVFRALRPDGTDRADAPTPKPEPTSTSGSSASLAAAASLPAPTTTLRARPDGEATPEARREAALVRPDPVVDPEPAAKRTPTPTPTPARTPTPKPTPVPLVLKPVPPSTTPPAPPTTRPAATPTPAATAAKGRLLLVVAPWAEVEVDGRTVGSTPLSSPLELGAGDHVVRLKHPDYHPLKRSITIQPGQTLRLEVDLTWEGFKR